MACFGGFRGVDGDCGLDDFVGLLDGFVRYQNGWFNSDTGEVVVAFYDVDGGLSLGFVSADVMSFLPDWCVEYSLPSLGETLDSLYFFWSGSKRGVSSRQYSYVGYYTKTFFKPYSLSVVDDCQLVLNHYNELSYLVMRMFDRKFGIVEKLLDECLVLAGLYACDLIMGLCHVNDDMDDDGLGFLRGEFLTVSDVLGFILGSVVVGNINDNSNQRSIKQWRGRSKFFISEFVGKDGFEEFLSIGNVRGLESSWVGLHDKVCFIAEDANGSICEVDRTFLK